MWSKLNISASSHHMIFSACKMGLKITISNKQRPQRQHQWWQRYELNVVSRVERDDQFHFRWAIRWLTDGRSEREGPKLSSIAWKIWRTEVEDVNRIDWRAKEKEKHSNDSFIKSLYSKWTDNETNCCWCCCCCGGGACWEIHFRSHFWASVHMFCVNILFGARVQPHARIKYSFSFCPFETVYPRF